LGRYADFSIGGDAPTSASGWLGKLRNEWFHVRYLASSTFAFPFLSLAFIGLAWRTVAGRRNGWLLVGLLLVAAVATLGIYGQGDHNYYGYGQGVVRASFVRYALPVYAALAVAVGAFLLDASRVLRSASRIPMTQMFMASTESTRFANLIERRGRRCGRSWMSVRSGRS
jgi:hypothetical protein